MHQMAENYMYAKVPNDIVFEEQVLNLSVNCVS